MRGVDGALRLPRADPVVNFQSAMSSFVVGAGSSSSDEARESRSRNDSSTTRISLSQLLPSAASRIAGFRRLVGDDDAGARVVEVVGVVLRLEERVRLGGDRADLLRAVPEGDELDGVGEDEQDAVLGPARRARAGRCRCGSRARRAPRRSSGPPAPISAVRSPRPSSTFRSTNQRREVELARQVGVA